MPKDSSRDQLRQFLSIDKNALDDCLMEQPEIYARVADAVAYSEAERDAAELAYDELFAELDQTVRQKITKEERVTEGAIKSQLLGLPKLKTAHRDLLDKKREAKQWRALEKAFEQRADMLKKLVDLHLRQTYGYALEAGVGQARGNMAEGHRTAVRAARLARG